MPELRKKRTVGEIARVLGVSRQNLYRMMQGKISLTPDMAAKIGALVGNGARIWLAMQADYDAWEATKRLAPALKKIRAEAFRGEAAARTLGAGITFAPVRPHLPLIFQLADHDSGR